MIATIAQGAALQPLSNEQKQYLAACAHFAYDVSDSQVDFETWRHAEVKRIVHRAGLRDCLNMHFNPLKAAWLDQAGHSGAAVRAELKHQVEPRTWVMHRLQAECAAAKDVMPEAMKYARGFVRNRTGLSLEDADEKTLQQAVFVVRRKTQAERRKKRGGESAGDVLSTILSRTPKAHAPAAPRPGPTVADVQKQLSGYRPPDDDENPY